MRPILFIATVLASAFTFAQQPPPKDQIDTKAKAILDELSTKSKSCNSIKSEFLIESIGTDKKVKETNTGTITTKGQKYILGFKGQKIISDSKVQWTVIDESKEIQVNEAPDPKATDNITPLNIYTLYEKDFKYKFEKEETLNGVVVQVINLYPNNPAKKPYHTIRLTIDKVKKQIIAVRVINKDATSTNITVKSYQCYTESDEGIFHVKKDDPKYKGYEWIDLREN